MSGSPIMIQYANVNVYLVVIWNNTMKVCILYAWHMLKHIDILLCNQICRGQYIDGSNPIMGKLYGINMCIWYCQEANYIEILL